MGWQQSARSIDAANRPGRPTIGQRKINDRSTIGRFRLNQAGDMDKRTCAQCGKILKLNHRGVFCARRCVWRAWRQRSVARGYEAQNLPLATPPPSSESILPAMGQERLRVASQLALLSRAPADARGYRVGIQQGSQQLMRWLPPARFRACSIRSRSRRCRCRAPMPWCIWMVAASRWAGHASRSPWSNPASGFC